MQIFFSSLINSRRKFQRKQPTCILFQIHHLMTRTSARTPNSSKISAHFFGMPIPDPESPIIQRSGRRPVAAPRFRKSKPQVSRLAKVSIPQNHPKSGHHSSQAGSLPSPAPRHPTPTRKGPNKRIRGSPERHRPDEKKPSTQ